MKRQKHSIKDPNQTELFAVLWMNPKHSSRLHAGDVFLLQNRLCRVIRVNDCAAVVIMNQKFREFKTRFDKPVGFQPAPATFRISPSSNVQILNRKQP
jgi:hypothetical protein